MIHWRWKIHKIKSSFSFRFRLEQKIFTCKNSACRPQCITNSTSTSSRSIINLQQSKETILSCEVVHFPDSQVNISKAPIFIVEKLLLSARNLYILTLIWMPLLSVSDLFQIWCLEREKSISNFWNCFVLHLSLHEGTSLRNWSRLPEWEIVTTLHFCLTSESLPLYVCVLFQYIFSFHSFYFISKIWILLAFR